MNNTDHLYGIYELHEITTTFHSTPTAEHAKSGMFVFTRDNKLSVVCGSNEMVMSYTGSFDLKDDALHIHVGSCSKREYEGTTITRRILQINDTWLKLEATSLDGATKSEITWKKKTAL
jgi:hypothetical protein